MARNHRVALVIALCVALGACVSPFSTHAEDHWDKFSKDAEQVHRKWDRYFLNLDWDDPYHDWHDESFARGPMQRR